MAAFLIVTLVYLWFVTYGTWRLFEPESFGQFQDAQARSLLAGRLDVPQEAIGPEAFIVNGKYYGYFGLTPTLLRLPLILLFPRAEDGTWSRSSMLAACLLTLASAYLLLRAVRRLHGGPADRLGERLAGAGFVLLTGLGSTNICLASRAFVYHEALMWGAAFGLLFYYLVVRYCLRPGKGTLAAASAASLLCVLARSTIGLGTLLTCAGMVLTLLVLRKPSGEGGGGGGILARLRGRRWDAAVLGIGILCTLSACMAVNYLKFGTPLESLPIRYHTAFIQKPEWLRQIGGKCFHVENLPFNAYSYFIKPGLRAGPTLPWIAPTERPVWPSAPAVLGCEPTVSLPAGMPALCLLSVLGLGSALAGRRPRILLGPMLAALAAGGPMLLATAVTQRYEHDPFPFLALTAAFGLDAVLSLPKAWHRAAALLGLAPLLCAGTYINSAFSLYYERDFIWGVAPERRAEYKEWGKRIQAWQCGDSR
jgi:hypothetical protein